MVQAEALRAMQLTMAKARDAVLPGGLEWEREQRYAREGVPISGKAAQYLEQLAGEFGLQAPW